MIDESAISAFRREVDGQIESLVSGIIGGACTDFPAYMKAVGTVSGLNRAKQALEEAIRSSRTEDLQDD